ncbi:hypothetical protein [Fimbriimonas ginsengisoli]|uniref:Uncharacterized protein n=1 Tax=Fimbriimonas ginsengisoli Gsoil 348 TaxID=661478 RepID=A0A068NU33_FIMGI|nr:hypothetical protein [Fimbriimonas ginsengisoli]AIE87033.1 hypothetical protein OP10G_3665 [Fimbriimonas ginsengisoli Gsoil 348]
MITIQLTKLESALDQIKKTHSKLAPADAALIATALSLTGRHAIALYEGEQYVWPDDYERLTRAMVSQINMVNEAIEHSTPKRAAKSTVEEEPVTVTVGLMPNLTAGENLLESRDDLKAVLSDILQEGVEFSYSPTDIGWQWALDRANWNTISNGEVSRRIKIKASFTEGAVGIEMGVGPKKRTTRASAKPIEIDEPVDAPDFSDVAEVAEVGD